MTKIPFLELNITTKCNLNCVGCSHYSPLAKNVKTYELSTIYSSISNLFNFCNNIERLNIVGGEPFLYKELPLILDYLRNYSINRITITTNGTIIPTENLLKSLKSLNIFVGINNYKINNNNSQYILELLRFHGIKCGINKNHHWIDYGNFKKKSLNLTEKRRCGGSFFQLAHDRLYICPKALRGQELGVYTDDLALDYIDLKSEDVLKKIDAFMHVKQCHICCTMCNRVKGCKKIPQALQIHEL